MLWIVFSVFWSFRVAPRSGTNAEWYQGPGPISISWISSPFSWNLHMKVQRREKTMLPNRLSHHPDELKLMIWRSGEINDWNQFLGVSWKGSTSTSKWRHPIQKSTLQWMKAETPVDCFQSSCLYDPSWRQFPRCILRHDQIVQLFFPVSTSHHVPTSLRRRRLVERRGLRVKEWRLVERRRRLRSWTRSWRRVDLLAMNEDCDALMQFAHFCPESLSVICVQCKQNPALLRYKCITSHCYATERSRKNAKISKKCQRCTIYIKHHKATTLHSKLNGRAWLSLQICERLEIEIMFWMSSYRRDRWLILNIKNTRTSFMHRANSSQCRTCMPRSPAVRLQHFKKGFKEAWWYKIHQKANEFNWHSSLGCPSFGPLAVLSFSADWYFYMQKLAAGMNIVIMDEPNVFWLNFLPFTPLPAPGHKPWPSISG